MNGLLKKYHGQREDGFTLIELLVVILIIGILAAIAIPLFLNQRKSAVDATVQSDIKNASTQVETWVGKQGTQETPIPTAWTTEFQGTKAADASSFSNLKINLSNGTALKVAGTSFHYVITAHNDGGDLAKTGYNYDSDTGTIGNGTLAAGPIQTVTCDNSTYSVSGNASIGCTVTILGNTHSHKITIHGTTATPSEWILTADWNSVTKFQQGKSTGPGVINKTVVAKTGTFNGNDGGSTNPADAWNHKYISTSKADESFTIEVNVLP